MGVKKISFRFHFLKSSSYPIFAKKGQSWAGLVTPTLVLDETFCDDHFPRILAATSPASVTIDGVVKLRMEEEGMGARSPISCYSTIRFDDGDHDDDVYVNDDGGGDDGGQESNILLLHD